MPSLEEIRRTNPRLAQAIEEQIAKDEARAAARAIEGTGFTSANLAKAMAAEVLAKAAAAPPPVVRRRGPFSARVTTCGAGHSHPSKAEAAVCDKIRPTIDPMETLFLQVRLPLISLSPTDRDRPAYFTVDFAVVRASRFVRLIDAKSRGGRRNREWARGRLAAQSSYGLPVEEIEP